MLGKGVFPGSGMICLRGRGFCWSSSRGNRPGRASQSRSGARAPDTVFARFVRPLRASLQRPLHSTLRRPAGPIASARLATTRALCTAGTTVLLGVFLQPRWYGERSCSAAFGERPARSPQAIGPGMRRGGVVLGWKICLAASEACGDCVWSLPNKPTRFHCCCKSHKAANICRVTGSFSCSR